MVQSLTLDFMHSALYIFTICIYNSIPCQYQYMKPRVTDSAM